MWVVYVLRSLRNDWLYIGMTSDVSRRLREHNRGYNRSTKGKGPFALVHSEGFATRPKARKREKPFKTGAGRKMVKQMLRERLGSRDKRIGGDGTCGGAAGR